MWWVTGFALACWGHTIQYSSLSPPSEDVLSTLCKERTAVTEFLGDLFSKIPLLWGVKLVVNDARSFTTGIITGRFELCVIVELYGE
jgi:hypothetical protein